MIKLRDMSVSSSKLDLKQSDIFGHEKHWDVPQDRDTTESKTRVDLVEFSMSLAKKYGRVYGLNLLGEVDVIWKKLHCLLNLGRCQDANICYFKT